MAPGRCWGGPWVTALVGVWNRPAAARAVVCRWPSRTCVQSPSRRTLPAPGGAAGLPARERRDLGSSSLWLWPGAWLAGEALPPVTQGPEELANRNLKIAWPGALLRPQGLLPAAQDPPWPPPPVLLPVARGTAQPGTATPAPPRPWPAALRCQALPASRSSAWWSPISSFDLASATRQGTPSARETLHPAPRPD